MKRTIKKIIPTKLWITIRKQSIIRKHTHVSRICNMLLDDYEKGRIEYDTMIENYIEFCSNPIFTEALKIEYYDKIKKAAEKTLVKTA